MALNGSCGNSNKHLSNGKPASCNRNGRVGNGQGEKDANTLLEEQAVAVCPPQQGYSFSIFKALLFYPLAILPACLGLLLAYWFPSTWIRLTCWKCPLDQATFVIVKDVDGKHRVEIVRKLEVEKPPSQSDSGNEDDPLVSAEDEKVVLLLGKQTVQYFQHRHLRYFYSEEAGKYLLLRAFDQGYSCDAIHEMVAGLTSAEQEERILRFGPNSLDVPVKPYHVLLIEEVLHPFYIFEILTVIFWMIDDYYYYAGAVLFISTLSILISLFQTRRQLQQLHDLVALSCTVNILRDGKEVCGVSSESLVPGDILVVPPTGMTVPCDAALLSGNAIVNEAMLTGESVPVTKTPLPLDEAHYHSTKHKKHTLFGGTQVIQTRFYGNAKVMAVVVRTGFATSKGGMVRSILFPKPLNMKFYSDAIKFVLVLAVLAFCGFCYTITVEQIKHYDVEETIYRAFDVITIVVPPALPAALTVGTVYALNRLRKQQIYCISPQRVNLCGKIKLVCFDKTGTLTEDSLDMFGVQPVYGRCFASIVDNPSHLSPSTPLLCGMATCHSLTNINGELAGDPLDLKMFLATKWTLEEPPGEDCTRFDTVVPTVVRPPRTPPQYTPPPCGLKEGEEEEEGEGGEELELGILRQFTFSSELQRMSVLVRALPCPDPRLLHVYVKGAPETIRKLCKPESVPQDFFEVLASLTQRGFRVLAVGHKTMHMPWHKAERVMRDVVECDLVFEGLIVMQNRLKPETTPVISTLTSAALRTVMITGDNLLTAVSVARECGMIASEHRAIMLRATLSSSGLPITSFHLLGEGHDTARLLSSGSSGYVSHVIEEGAPEDSDATPLLAYQNEPALDMDRRYHLVIDGRSFAIIREHCSLLFERLLVRGTVFARMSPDQKAQLVCALQDIGYAAAMCGDGANDCGALKMAHAGISLSETEASVASPFTSKVPNITCVPKVLKEGRCALVTSFSVFKFMALYSLAEFISAAILYAYESNLGDWQYLYIDLVLILSFAFVMGFTGPYPHLVKRRPPGSLAGVHVLLSVILQTLLLVMFQVGALYFLKEQYWYKPLIPDPEGANILCSENTVVFTVSIFQYVGLVVALSTAAPYRRPLFTNYWFVLTLLILFPLNLYIALAPPTWWPWFWSVMQLEPPTSLSFRITIIEIALIYCTLAYLLEGYVFSSSLMYWLVRHLRCKKQPRNRYKHILADIEPMWPPVEVEGDNRGIQSAC